VVAGVVGVVDQIRLGLKGVVAGVADIGLA
jgi:hypothetical protein